MYSHPGCLGRATVQTERGTTTQHLIYLDVSALNMIASGRHCVIISLTLNLEKRTFHKGRNIHESKNGGELVLCCDPFTGPHTSFCLRPVVFVRGHFFVPSVGNRSTIHSVIGVKQDGRHLKSCYS